MPRYAAADIGGNSVRLPAEVPPGAPPARHEGFAARDEGRKRTVQLRTPLLGLAGGRDRGHEQPVEEIECRLPNSAIVVMLRSSRDTDLEQWAAERVPQAEVEACGLPLNVARSRV